MIFITLGPEYSTVTVLARLAAHMLRPLLIVITNPYKP
jgi:hypothetical protein